MRSFSYLVGIPWEVGGTTVRGCDCIGLAIMAQNIFFDRNFDFPEFDSSRNEIESKRMRAEFPVLYNMHPVKGAHRSGDWGVITFGACDHVITFLEPNQALHIIEGGTSRISTFRSILKKIQLFRYREEGHKWE